MKTFIFVAAVVAAVAGEADPWGIYGYGLNGYAAAGLGYAGLGYSRLAAPLAAAPIAAAAPLAAAPIVAGRLWKREAEAEPEAEAEADPSYLGLGYNSMGLGYAAPIVSRRIAAAPLVAAPLAGLGLGYAGIAAGRLWKREAEPEAEAEADPSYLGLGYNSVGLGYAAPIVSRRIAAAPLVAAPLAGLGLGYAGIAAGRLWKREAEAEPEADPSYLGLGYNTLGLGYAAPIVSRRIAAAPLVAAPLAGLGLGYSGIAAGRLWKREAEAEADPSYLAGVAGIGYAGIAAPFAYAAGIPALKSAPCVNAANIPVPCNAAPLIAGRIWKREAEAEPSYLGYAARGYAAAGYAARPLGIRRIAGLGYNRPLVAGLW